ncbi:WGxxGxxG family protein [Paenibacillus sp. HB172176]|uniref:WGxxGxxG family protein n=1 Tax=Paenibacillus sp. HB172176 TaxID=2493690 RepID=UPI001F0D1164|nr:WGxxGxxG family protein [Paenibacillus sp. HB172176]
MKKAGIIAVIFACFTFIFALPAAHANNMKGTYTDNSVTNDMNRGYQNMKNDINRTTHSMKYDMNRATNRVENGVNRAATNVENGVNRVLDVNDNNYDYNRTNMMNRTNYKAANYRTMADTTNNNNFNWGWLGLLGLIGLAGLRNRDRGRA